MEEVGPAVQGGVVPRCRGGPEIGVGPPMPNTAYPHSSWYECLLGETGINHALVEYGIGKTQIQQSGMTW